MNPRVYVTQLPHRRDPATGALAPVLNISPASEHGEIVVMFPPQGAYFDTTELREIANRQLRDFRKEDSLLLLGDTVLCAMAVMVAYEYAPVGILRYDRVLKKYARVVLE